MDGTSGVTETNGSLRSRAIQVAMELLAREVKSTDVIVVSSRLHADQTAVVLGVLLAGSIVAPIDADIGHQECLAFFESMKPKIIFCDLRVMGQIERALSELGKIESCQLVIFGNTPTEPKSFEHFLKNKADPDFQATTIKNPKERVAFILQTQGTCELPKLVCVSHQYIFEQTRAFLRMLNNPERIISFFPLSTLIQAVIMCLCFESPVTRVLPGTISERNACLMIHDLRIDHAFCTTDFALSISVHPALHVST